MGGGNVDWLGTAWARALKWRALSNGWTGLGAAAVLEEAECGSGVAATRRAAPRPKLVTGPVESLWCGPLCSAKGWPRARNVSGGEDRHWRRLAIIRLDNRPEIPDIDGLHWRQLMDGRQFDSLISSLARGTNRRTVLKRLFGLGGAAVVSGGLHASGADAARRPSSAPRPMSCPGQQTWDGQACVCPLELDKCGPDCCPDDYECCDNACCDGHCSAEEICCPWDRWCEATGECCPAGTACCPAFGCVVVDEGWCCVDDDCPAEFECCGGDCCAGGYCSSEGCCAIGVCGDHCLSVLGNQCCAGVEYDPESQVCCTGVVYDGNCCDSDDCDMYEGICWVCSANHQCEWQDCA